MSDDLINRLRHVTEYDAYALPWTFGETCREAALALESALARVAKLEARLEITHVTDGNGNRFEIPSSMRGSIHDGIYCRDQTIDMQDAVIKMQRSQIDALEAAKRENERLREAGAMLFEGYGANFLSEEEYEAATTAWRAALATDQKGGE